MKLGEFFNVKDEGDRLAIRLGECMCGALVCTRCQSVVERSQQRSHMCRNATAEVDPATKALMAKVCKPCPGCGNLIQFTEVRARGLKPGVD